jgi:hypothetical protein
MNFRRLRLRTNGRHYTSDQTQLAAWRFEEVRRHTRGAFIMLTPPKHSKTETEHWACS